MVNRGTLTNPAARHLYVQQWLSDGLIHNAQVLKKRIL